jgi:hypothetical protein
MASKGLQEIYGCGQTAETVFAAKTPEQAEESDWLSIATLTMVFSSTQLAKSAVLVAAAQINSSAGITFFFTSQRAPRSAHHTSRTVRNHQLQSSTLRDGIQSHDFLNVRGHRS